MAGCCNYVAPSEPLRDTRAKGLSAQIEALATKAVVSPAGTRTRVFRVRAEYPDQLDYRGGG